MNFMFKKIPNALNMLYRVVAYLAFAVFAFILGTLANAMLNDDFETITKLLVPLGVLLSAALAAISIMKSIENTNRIEYEKKEFELSEFYLQKSLIELENVYDLLKDKNNNRVTWILASRVLLLSYELEKNITNLNHFKVYELQKFQIRHKLSEILNRESGIGLKFFAGYKKNSSASDEKILSEIKGHSDNQRLSGKSVFVIFGFLEYEDNYSDPLKDIKLPSDVITLEKWKKKGSIADTKRIASEYIRYKENII